MGVRDINIGDRIAIDKPLRVDKPAPSPKPKPEKAGIGLYHEICFEFIEVVLGCVLVLIFILIFG